MKKDSGRAAETSATAPERVELKGLFTMMLGVWYPQNYILAAIEPREGAAAVKASTAANPQRRYTAGRAARQISLLRRFVPAAAFDKSLRKQMRLPA